MLQPNNVIYISPRPAVKLNTSSRWRYLRPFWAGLCAVGVWLTGAVLVSFVLLIIGLAFCAALLPFVFRQSARIARRGFKAIMARAA